jgi:predicted nucleic acid-binding protein
MGRSSVHGRQRKRQQRHRGGFGHSRGALVIYLDTSALIKLYIREEGSERVQEKVSSQSVPLPVWEVLEMELVNALRLQVFWENLSEKEVEHQIHLFHERKKRGYYFVPEIDRSSLLTDFNRLSKETQKLGCRTLDILHVACALQLKVTDFVSFDRRQVALAEVAGLNV